jgi:transposase
MCLKPAPPRPIPDATAALVADLFDDGSVYQFVGDVLFEQFRDEDFADLYPADGQPALSPVLLSFVTIFQSLEDLSDRKTVYGLRFRFDWKYALHLPPSYCGFDHTVLSEFRQRLLKHGAEARVFNAIFAQLKQLGLYKHKGIQRTDSLAIYTHCRLLTRIELCVETMRTVIKELLHRDLVWTRATLPVAWEERYARRCRSERLTEEERQSLAVVVGDDGQWLLNRLQQEDAAHLAELRAVETLRDVWKVHYECGADGHLRWIEGGERGGSHAIETPHDPEARWSTKRSSDWVGYKLQVTETDDDNHPHLITDIAITSAPTSDMTVITEIRERQAQQQTLPSERFVDSGYVSGENIKDGRTCGEELLCPIRTTVTPQSKILDGFNLYRHALQSRQRRAGHASCHDGAITDDDFPPTVAGRARRSQTPRTPARHSSLSC